MIPDKVKEIKRLRHEISKLNKKIEELSNSKEVKIYWHNYYNIKTFKFIRKEIKKGNMVWCRNATICFEATPCKDLLCKFKAFKEDIISGCAKCHRFQVTTFANRWGAARHITPEWLKNLPAGT